MSLALEEEKKRMKEIEDEELRVRQLKSLYLSFYLSLENIGIIEIRPTKRIFKQQFR